MTQHNGSPWAPPHDQRPWPLSPPSAEVPPDTASPVAAGQPGDPWPTFPRPVAAPAPTHPSATPPPAVSPAVPYSQPAPPPVQPAPARPAAGHHPWVAAPAGHPAPPSVGAAAAQGNPGAQGAVADHGPYDWRGPAMGAAAPWQPDPWVHQGPEVPRWGPPPESVVGSLEPLRRNPTTASALALWVRRRRRPLWAWTPRMWVGVAVAAAAVVGVLVLSL